MYIILKNVAYENYVRMFRDILIACIAYSGRKSVMKISIYRLKLTCSKKESKGI